jgi:uncharacterized NAD(P)/FAD-binding protein YdhS
MRRNGRLRVAAGKITEIDAGPNACATITWRPRGGFGQETLRVRRIVNCTGPQASIARAGEPLLDTLLAAGRIRPGSCGIGVDVDERCRVVDLQGKPSPDLLAIGPLTRGTFWEIVAVPDIRIQVHDLARSLTDEHT